MFSLLLHAYHACNQDEREYFDKYLATDPVDMQGCCVNVIRSLKDHRVRTRAFRETCEIAAAHGHMKCLKYAHENGAIWNNLTYINAAKAGRLDCMKYAFENGCTWGPWRYIYTAAGPVDHMCRIQPEQTVCAVAAEYGHLDCLKFAFENGCAWDAFTTNAAAKAGHLDCLRYAHENDCPWDEQTYKYALMNGHSECAQYAEDNDCPKYTSNESRVAYLINNRWVIYG
ncbi:uncharacterized protein LOC126847778 [Adelges cooleyi]|uniref:uncharacterized protein LOC126841240 n=1 Tax=Adelges cooleyi TaxID=133065 RepID=UPI00218088DF|nr:uncharacterized protein LOC126841240 [Adelges cooleyi]XP_050444135.1 uncharacterized protein LOC126847778 [Adelges cooleyi]